MHLWIAATIAFCCVIVTETQAQQDALGGFTEIPIDDNVKALAERTMKTINIGRVEKLRLIKVQKAEVHVVEGMETLLELLVESKSCGRGMGAGCRKKQKVCKVLVWQKPWESFFEKVNEINC